GTATATLQRRGLPVLVVDTLPDEVGGLSPDGTDRFVADLAWRLRRTEREQFLTALAREGCPVVAWRGPGTLDDVLHRLARPAQLPPARVRWRGGGGAGAGGGGCCARSCCSGRSWRWWRGGRATRRGCG